MRGHREQIQLPSGHSFRVLRWTRNVREVDSVLAPDCSTRIAGEGTRWHYHEAMELTWFLRGEGTRFVGDHIARFADDDIVLLGANLPHYWHTQGASAGAALQWNFPHGHPFWAFPETGELADLFRDAGRGIRYTGPTAAAIKTTLQKIAETTAAERLGLLFRLLAHLAHTPAEDRQFLSGRPFALPHTESHRQAIADAVRYLMANFRDEIRLADVLKLTRMSKPTFSRQFKLHAGRTFTQFVAQVRLQAVCRELIETERPILEIALSCGFGQLSFFNRLFRRLHGCSPRMYRAAEKAKLSAYTKSQ